MISAAKVRESHDMSETRKRPQRASALKNAHINDGFSEADSEVDSESDMPKIRRKSRPPKKKAKTTAKDAPAGTSRRKTLSKLLDMPMDILYEIFSALHPKDILSLSRTSRVFRLTLSPSTARSVWRAALDKDGAPDCPSDWTEPRWAALLYDHHCQECLTKNIQKIDYHIRRRLCSRCRKAVILSEQEVRQSVWAHSDVRNIMDLTPRTRMPPSGRSRAPAFWHLKDLDATGRRLENLQADKKALQTWMKEERKLLEEIQTLATECVVWKNTRNQERHEDEREITEQRFFDISERLRALGYSNDDIQSIKWTSIVQIPRPLTEKSWNNISTRLIAAIAASSESRLVTALLRRYVERRRIVDNIYNTWKRKRTPFECHFLPYTISLCLLPELKGRIEANLDVDDTFSDVGECLPALILAHEEMLRREAQSTLANAGSPTERAESDEPIDLNLATSVLMCGQCSALIFGWSEHQRHKCIIQETGLCPHQLAIPLENRTYRRPPLLPESATEVVRMAGLDPATATVEDMDIAMTDVYLICTAQQHTPGTGFVSYFSWRSYLHHCISGLWQTGCQMEHAPDDVVATISTRQSTFLQDHYVWCCNYCPYDRTRQLRRDCIQHLRADHNIQDPTINVDMSVFDPFLRHNSIPVII